LEAIEMARAQGASVVCLPELCLTGYGCEDTFLAPDTLRQAYRSLEAVIPATRGLVVSVGLPCMVNNAIFNVAALMVDGSLCGMVAKQHLAGDGIHYEPRWFKPWPAGIRDKVTIAGREVPVGDLHFVVGGVRIGFEICEDAWVASRPGVQLAQRGIDVILNPSASHFAFGKIEIRQRFVLEGSRAFGCSYVYANLLGNEAGRAIYDGEAMIATAGRLVAVGPRFSFADVRVTHGVVDVDVTRLQQARLASFQPHLVEDAGAVTVEFEWAACGAGGAGSAACGLGDFGSPEGGGICAGGAAGIV
jgi:NAD+ synthase (glutamine-hydrolysing)